MQEVERDLCLLEEAAQIMHWEVWFRCAESRNEIILEGDDGPLRCIKSVHAWSRQFLVEALVL